MPTPRSSKLSTALAWAVLSGILYGLAFPPLDLWPLAFVSAAPLLIALHRRSPKQALAIGAAQGLIANVACGTWLPSVIRTFGELPWFVCGLFAFFVCLYASGRAASLAWLAARAEKNGWPKGLALVLAFAGSEALYPLLFPWYAAVQVHRVPVLMQLAELGGPVLVGIPLLMAGIAVAEPIWARMDGRPVDRRRVQLALAGPVLMGLFGAVRIPMIRARIAAAPAARVALVQGNLPHTGASLQEALDAHRDATARVLAKEPVDLVVWPETALNDVVGEPLLEPTLRGVTSAAHGSAAISAPLLTGALVQRSIGTTNSAALFAKGHLQGTYDKVHPLAFGEYIPFGDLFPALYTLIPNAGHLTRGTSEEPLLLGDAAGHRISPLICYEDILASPANHAIATASPDLLVNLTNDSWFGDSSAAKMHFALASFRAVEHRRYLVRASNSGVSGFIDPTGTVRGTTPMLEAATRVGTVHWMRTVTVYERLGDAPWWCAALVILAMAFVPRRAFARVERFGVTPSAAARV
ncbi:MAG TPA: apolipoprotein N-acyltransferase [Polyangiaceae bacterium]|jgi:apolipoprotein N-acyltransferase